MIDIPLPPMAYQEWFLLEYGFSLEHYWKEDGLDIEKFKQEILGFDVPDEELLSAISEKFGVRAARCIQRLEEYMLVQVGAFVSGRLN